jgi:heme exporter protein C
MKPSRMPIAAPLFIALSAIGFVVSVWIVSTNTPLSVNFNDDGSLVRSSLFFNQKIVYFHVAHAFAMFAAVILAGVCSAVFLKTRNARWDDIALAAVEVAAAFGLVVLVTGSIWAKAAWDVWWNTEPRLTLSLLLWLMLMSYVIVRRFAGPSADRIAAGMALFGMIVAFFVYKMVGQDSHPAAGSQGVVATLPPGMRGPFWLSVGVFLCWYVALVIYRVRGTRAERELRELRERGLDLGVLS